MSTLGDGAQAGDIASRDSAGRDLYHGLSGEQLMQVLEQQSEFYLTLVSAYERQATDLNAKLQRLRDENDMYRAGERAAREQRQSMLDQRLNRIEGAIVLLALALALFVWRLWPAITAAAAFVAAQ